MCSLSTVTNLFVRVFLLAACVLVIPVSSTQSAFLSINKLFDSAANSSVKPSVNADQYPWKMDLIDGYGNAFNLASQQGKVWVLSFFFTQCVTRCPVQNVKLSHVQKNLPESILERSHFVSISIDPMGDTVARISNYQKPFLVNPSHWSFGKAMDFESLHALLEQLAVVRPGASLTGEIDHRTQLFLINPEGTIVQQYSGTQFDEGRLISEIGVLVEMSQST